MLLVALSSFAGINYIVTRLNHFFKPVNGCSDDTPRRCLVEVWSLIRLEAVLNKLMLLEGS